MDRGRAFCAGNLLLRGFLRKLRQADEGAARSNAPVVLVCDQGGAFLRAAATSRLALP